MSLEILTKFGGMLPAWQPETLPEGQAASSKNAYLFSGGLTGWRQPKLLRALNDSAAKFVYRIPNITLNNGVETFDNDIAAPSLWLEFEDIDTNVVKSQVVNDQFQRYYFVSPSVLPQYNTYKRLLAGKPNFNLGISPPGCAPSVQVSGGGNTGTLGWTTSDGNTDPVLGNYIYLLPIVPTGAVTVADISISLSGGDTEFAGVVYQDAAEGPTPTTPGTLLATGAQVSASGSGTATSTFANPPALIAGTAYWIGILNSTGGVAANEGSGTLPSGNPPSATTYAFPNTWSNGPAPVAPTDGYSGQIDFQMWADVNSLAPYEARSYVYTWVSAYGEESAPSPFTLQNGWSNGTWTIGVYNPPANCMGNTGIENVAIIRLYRTVTGSSGSTVYYWVADISTGSSDPDALATYTANPYVPATFNDGTQTSMATGVGPAGTTYVDNNPDNLVALTTQLPSTNYYPPPNNLYVPVGSTGPLPALQGLMVLPNGMYVGFVNNQIWFSEPYYPHAWPPGQVYTTDYPIVGLGYSAATGLVACTAANAWILQGVTPTQMSMMKCSKPEPCTSRGSIMSTDIGVFYISPNGLVLVAGTTATNTSDLWITPEKWAQLVPLKYTRAINIASEYVCFGSVQNGDDSVAQQGFTVELATDNTSFTIWPQPGGHRVGFNLMSAPYNADIVNVLQDPWTSYGLMIQNGNVYWWDFLDPAPTITPYDYMSKTYMQRSLRSFEAMRVFFSVPSGSPTPGLRNEAPTNDPSWNTLAADQLLIVKVWADTNGVDETLQLVCAREVQKSGEVLRIPDGFKATHWAWEFIGRVAVSEAKAATSLKELANAA